MSSSYTYSLSDNVTTTSGKILLAPINMNTKTNLECLTHNLSYKISLLSKQSDDNNHHHTDNHRSKNYREKMTTDMSKNGSKHTAEVVIPNNNDKYFSTGSKDCDDIHSSSYNKAPSSNINGVFIDTLQYKVDDTAVMIPFYHNYNDDHNYNTKRNHLEWIDDTNLYKDCIEVPTVSLDTMIIDGLLTGDVIIHADETTTTTASMYNDPIFVDSVIYTHDIEDSILEIVNLDNNSIRNTSSVNIINIHDHNDIDIADSNSMITTSKESSVKKSSIGGGYIEIEENNNNCDDNKGRLVEGKYCDNKLPRINTQPQHYHHHHHFSINSDNLRDNIHNDVKKENKTSKELRNTKLPPI